MANYFPLIVNAVTQRIEELAAGAGLDMTSSNIANANIITAVGNITTTANISGNYILGNGAFLSGVITSVANINSGSSNVTVVSPGGNITVGIGGTANVVVFASTGEYVTGVLSASGNVTGGNLVTGGLISATGNITGGNILGGANVNATTHTGTTVSVTANVTGGNLVTGGLASVTGNVTGGNLTTTGISNVGTLAVTGAGTIATTLGVTGNITGGNLTTTGIANVGTLAVTGTSSHTGNATFSNISGTGSAAFTGNVSGGNLLTSSIVGTAVTITSTGALNLAPSGNITANSKNINNLADPAQAQDAATKNYVDSVAQGLDVKASVSAATTGTLATASGGTVTYNNGSSGVGATLTTTGTYALIDTVNIASVGTRILVKNEANVAHNGIYTYTSSTVLTRSTDCDTGTEISNAFTFVEDGATQGDTGWVCTANSPITVGTTNLPFSQFSGAGTYSAGTGLTLTGTTFSVNASQTQVTSVGTLGSLSVTGNTTSGNLLTGGQLSASGNVTGSNLITTGLLSVTGNANVGNIGATNIVGTLTTASQTNITSVGTLGSLSVTGNITGGNILGGANVNATTHTGTTVSVTANITGGNLITGGLISATGNITGGNIMGGANVNATTHTGTTVSVTANITGGNLTTSGKISATGNISTAGMFSSQDIETSANVTAVGNVSSGNLKTVGQVIATGNITGGNIITVGLISSTGNITTAANVNGANLTLTAAISAAGNITAANITGGNLLTGGIVSAFGNVTGGNINTLGLISASGNVTGNYFLGNGSQLTGIITSVSSMSNGNSNVAIASTGGNVQVAVNGVSNVVVIGQGTLSVLGPMATAKTISANSVVADSVNAVLISPVTIGNGISVTVPTSSTLYIFAPA